MRLLPSPDVVALLQVNSQLHSPIDDTPRQLPGVSAQATLHDIDGPRPGGSLWQSVTRGQPTEVDYLCGEVVRLARLAGLATPANELLQRLTHSVTSGQLPIGGTPEESVLTERSASWL